MKVEQFGFFLKVISAPLPPLCPPSLVMQPLLTPCQMVLTISHSGVDSLQRAFSSSFSLLFFHLNLYLCLSLFPFCAPPPAPPLCQTPVPSLEAKQICLSCLSARLQCQLGRTCSYGCCVERNESNYAD